MVAYVIARMTVHDAENLREYADLAAPHTASHLKRYLKLHQETAHSHRR